MCDASQLAIGIRGRSTQPTNDRKDHKAELGLRLSRTKDRAQETGMYKEGSEPQEGGSLDDTGPGCATDRGLQTPVSPLTHTAPVFPADTRGRQF